MAFRHDPISEFIRCYKAFIVLSMQYSLCDLQQSREEVVPFRDNIRMFNMIYDLERNWRMYILLEGIFLMVDKYPVPFSIDNRNFPFMRKRDTSCWKLCRK